jgi:hypothetical protein
MAKNDKLSDLIEGFDPNDEQDEKCEFSGIGVMADFPIVSG